VYETGGMRGIKTKTRLINEFKLSVKTLELTPQLFPCLSDPLPKRKCRKLVFGKRYLIIYKLGNNKSEL
jgi:hypothetical protein